ncbi:Uncharacterized protein dnm_065580 [Desulfonema magnum]|uniref:Uncharacterized protein n=1 Tax=Desulfonema magnum TaxID=45655 RepID=A0A975BS90_9BACT|nr:Uncharacterized protein dnm_065580 [Desulfonema magnum]
MSETDVWDRKCVFLRDASPFFLIITDLRDADKAPRSLRTCGFKYRPPHEA